MKSLAAALLVMSLFSAVALAVNTQFQTRVIKNATLTIHVRDGVSLTVRNFTQDNDAGGQRGVIVVGIFPPTPTPAPTATPPPTCTPTCSPSPCAPTPCPPTPTPTPSPTPTPTPTPIMGNVLVASIAEVSAAPLITPDYIKRIIIAGPAILTIDPVPNATLSITYRKTLQPSGLTPTPTATSTTSSTATSSTATTSTVSTASTSSLSVIATASPSDDDDSYSSTPTPTPVATSTPTATPLITPTPSPTPTP